MIRKLVRKSLDLTICLGSGIIGVTIFVFYLGRKKIVITDEENKIIFAICKMRTGEYLNYNLKTRQYEKG